MKETKEKFCSPCALAIPAALGAVGIGSSAAIGSQEKDQLTQNIIFYSSIGVICLSIVVFRYLKVSKNGNKCKAK